MEKLIEKSYLKVLVITMNNYLNLIKKYGTPCYIYDETILEKRIRYLRSKFNNDYKFIYAVKANSFILEFIDKYVDGYELCSFGEFEICKSLKLNERDFLISGVNKDYDSIDYIFKNSNVDKFTIESINQYKLIEQCATKHNKKVNIFLRLTSGNQFGMSENDLDEVIKLAINNKCMNILGIEYFSGTQKDSIKILAKEINYLNDFVNYIEKKHQINIHVIEFGPGLPVSYFDTSFDESTFLDELNKLLMIFGKRKINLEIGRSLVASCGMYATTVTDIKSNKNGNAVILDGGINHLVYYGQTMAMRTPNFEVFYQNSGPKYIYNLYGSLCTINDIILKNVNLNKLECGDIFIFKDVGAYSVTEGISLFLSRTIPKVILIDKEKNNYLVRKEIKTSYINCPIKIKEGV